MESLNPQVVAVLIPLEKDCHKIPHLKALVCSIWHASVQGRCSTFKHHYTVLKSTILLHKRAKRRFHLIVAVLQVVQIYCVWNHRHIRPIYLGLTVVNGIVLHFYHSWLEISMASLLLTFPFSFLHQVHRCCVLQDFVWYGSFSVDIAMAKDNFRNSLLSWGHFKMMYILKLKMVYILKPHSKVEFA